MKFLDRLKNAWDGLRGRGPVKVAEATEEEIYGTPVDLQRLYTFRGFPLVPVWGPEQRPEKNQTIRTMQELDRARNASRILAEQNPNAAGLIDRMMDYVVGRGSSLEVHSSEEDEEPPVRLSEKVRGFCKRFRKVNNWTGSNGREREMVRRLIRDGEFFLRFYPNEDDDPPTTRVRWMPPATVRPPQGESADGPWAWGVYTPDFDLENPQAYNFHDWRTGRDEQVEAQFIIHGKINCDADAKRGIPSFYACAEELIGSHKLRYAAREGEKNRQAIPYFRVHDSATEQDVADWQARTATRQLNRDVEPGFGPQTINVQKIEPGEVQDVSAGFNVKPPPVGDAAGASEGVMAALEAVAARLGVPVWMVSGKNSDANFATALTTESPFTKGIETWQAIICEFSDAAQTKAVEIGAEQDVFPEDVLERIDLLVTLPSPITRNKLEETNRRKILHEANVLSETTWATEEGLDPKQQKSQILEERQDPIPPLPTKVPSVPVDPRTGQPVAPPPSGTPQARYAQLTGPLREQAMALLEAEHREIGEVWQGESGRWFTRNREGHVVPHAGPEGGSEGGGDSGRGGGEGSPPPPAARVAEARNTRQAEEMARAAGLVKDGASYKGVDVEMANFVNSHLASRFDELPGLKGRLDEIVTVRNKNALMGIYTNTATGGKALALPQHIKGPEAYATLLAPSERHMEKTGTPLYAASYLPKERLGGAMLDHELAHLVEHKILSPEDRNEWGSVYHSVPVEEWGKLSVLAGLGREKHDRDGMEGTEAFAESLSLAMNGMSDRIPEAARPFVAKMLQKAGYAPTPAG